MIGSMTTHLDNIATIYTKLFFNQNFIVWSLYNEQMFWFIESFNNFYYFSISKQRNGFLEKSYANILFNTVNFFKIGIVYGLIVDGFKLGS